MTLEELYPRGSIDLHGEIALASCNELDLSKWKSRLDYQENGILRRGDTVDVLLSIISIEG